MLIKKISDFTEEQSKKITTKKTSVFLNGYEYKVEAISSDDKINAGSNIELFATVAIYDGNGKIVFHEVFTQPLTKDQMESAMMNISSEPGKYINS